MLYFEDLQVGQSAETTRVVTDDDIARFAAVSGDHNPVHMDPAFAAGTVFEGPIAHGMLGASFISALIGAELPGPGAVYVSQTLEFKRAIRAGDAVRVSAEVVALDAGKAQVTLKTQCHVGRKAMIDGLARVSVPARAGEPVR